MWPFKKLKKERKILSQYRLRVYANVEGEGEMLFRDTPLDWYLRGGVLQWRGEQKIMLDNVTRIELERAGGPA